MTQQNPTTRNVEPYGSVHPLELILRDQLAIDRTVLANERTLLAYVLTALTLFLVGISFVHLPDLHPDPSFGGLAYDLTGSLFVVAAVVVLAIGYVRYRGFQADILSIQQSTRP